MSVKMRQRVEKIIARRVIVDMLAAGFSLNLDNGGDGFELPTPTTDARLMMKTMFATDDERLYVFKDGKQFGWVLFIYGNDGYDVVSDYTTNLEPQMAGSSKLAEKYG